MRMALDAHATVLAVTGLAREARIASGPGVRAVASGGNARRLAEMLDSECRRGAIAIISFGIAGGLRPGLGPRASVVARKRYDDPVAPKHAHGERRRTFRRENAGSEKEDAASAFADTLAGAFQSALATHAKGADGKPAPVRLLGPAECPVFRLKNFYRFHFQVQADSSAALHDVLRAALATARPPSGVEFQVDIDPYSML